MIITCPQCGFSREVPSSRFAGKKVIATCPKCECRFPIVDAGAMQDQDGEEEDIRVVASRAYQREADRFKKENSAREGEAKSVSNPWANAPGDMGWFMSFYQTALGVMFTAPYFFRHLKSRAAIGKALAFYLVVIIAQILFERIWGYIFLSFLLPGTTNDPQLEKMLSLLLPDNNLVLSIILRAAMLVVQLYIFTFLLFLAYRLMAPGKTTFSLVFQIMAYSSAPSLLGIIPVAGSIAGLFWSIGCLLAGCRAALGLDWARVIIGFLPIIFLTAPLFFQMLQLLSGAAG